ncbi:hypothetical protein NDU88_007606 [Pleurodeles waltl]|uniref:Uncharacterized protein n=1 Tax=Pleurodeles waltl TaxID=8319 RepID=A0AAV7ST55_PLEWA|nr:hypothetical protein NDU88_007606 [Pleurodeles waltl]
MRCRTSSGPVIQRDQRGAEARPTMHNFVQRELPVRPSVPRRAARACSTPLQHSAPHSRSERVRQLMPWQFKGPSCFQWHPR